MPIFLIIFIIYTKNLPGQPVPLTVLLHPKLQPLLLLEFAFNAKSNKSKKFVFVFKLVSVADAITEIKSSNKTFEFKFIKNSF